jgi:hypothetical protein
MQRGRGDLSGAIVTLRQYLDHYMNDRESWEELAELYLEVGKGIGVGRVRMLTTSSY